MGEYSVRIRASAHRELEDLPAALLQRIIPKIEALADHPRPPGCRKLRNSADLWRLRIGDYRVVYAINDKAKTIDVLRVRHRREIY